MCTNLIGGGTALLRQIGIELLKYSSNWLLFFSSDGSLGGFNDWLKNAEPVEAVLSPAENIYRRNIQFEDRPVNL